MVDPNYSDKGEKRFEAGKLTSKKIDSLLSQSKTLLKIRQFAGLVDLLRVNIFYRHRQLWNQSLFCI
jgi:hypothetical protein